VASDGMQSDADSFSPNIAAGGYMAAGTSRTSGSRSLRAGCPSSVLPTGRMAGRTWSGGVRRPQRLLDAEVKVALLNKALDSPAA
jgi:hypothetical protein